ncbi:Uncharacterised protein [uncultured archaeon]|nr:Uncharacterised protein [uncultured archaeon]
MIVKRRRRRRKPYATKGKSLVAGLIRTLEQQDLNQQVEKVADHFGMSKSEVLTQILGR